MVSYSCEDRRPVKGKALMCPPPPFLCNYMGRPSAAGRRPFRFILNRSRAVAGNGYLMMYPKPELEEMMGDDPDLKRRVWEALRAIPMDALIAQGRTYPGGLHKLEPRELERVGIALSPGLPPLR